MICLNIFLGGSKTLKENNECNTNPNHRTIGTSWYWFIVNINICKDFLSSNSYEWSTVIRSTVTIRIVKIVLKLFQVPIYYCLYVSRDLHLWPHQGKISGFATVKLFRTSNALCETHISTKKRGPAAGCDPRRVLSAPVYLSSPASRQRMSVESRGVAAIILLWRGN